MGVGGGVGGGVGEGVGEGAGVLGRSWEQEEGQEVGAGVSGVTGQDNIPLTFDTPGKLVFRGAGTVQG